MRCLQRLGLAFLVMLIYRVPIYPQATAVVQITGTVQDAAGAVVPDAEIKAVQSATGFVRQPRAGKMGRMCSAASPSVFTRSRPTHVVSRLICKKGVLLQVNTNPTVNIVLEIGAVSQSIEVRATAEMAETQTSGVSQVTDQRRVVDLPLNGRQPTQLVLL